MLCQIKGARFVECEASDVDYSVLRMFTEITFYLLEWFIHIHL